MKRDREGRAHVRDTNERGATLITMGGAEPRLLLVDGHAYAYRAFHAIRDLRGPDGRPTNAIFGFIQAFQKLRQRLQPSHAAVLWDGGLAAERVEALPEYKAQRPEMPETLRVQLDPIVAWLRAAGVATGCQEGVEADDWIAALARWAEGKGWNVIIASSDKDFMQLVSDRIGLVNPNDASGRVWTAQEVREKTGVDPRQIVDWLSLVGDTSDNIPGVPGVGPKTAAALLRKFGTIDAMLDRIGEVEPERIRNAVREAADVVRRNQSLVRLRTDLPPGFQPAELELRDPNVPELRRLYQQWGFRTLLERLGDESERAQSNDPQTDWFADLNGRLEPHAVAPGGEKVDNPTNH